MLKFGSGEKRRSCKTIVLLGHSETDHQTDKLYAEVVNNDANVAGRLKVIFFPDINHRNYCEISPHLREASDQMRSGYLSHENAELFKPLCDSLLDHDHFLLLADYQFR